MDNLSVGLFPTLATTFTSNPYRELPISPYLELARRLVSPQIRSLFNASTLSLWKGSEDDTDSSSGRSIYIGAEDVKLQTREVVILRLEAQYK